MIINQSILPFYTDRAYQHNNFRWYAQRLYSPLVAPAGYLPTFQIVRTINVGASLSFTLRNCSTGVEADITSDVIASGLTIDQTYSYDVILYSATLPISINILANYEIIATDGINTWYSEKWAMSDQTSGMIKLTYWHLEDFEFDQDVDGNSYYIKYTAPFKNVAYIDSELFKPKYPYYREVEQRLGRNLDKLHISAKEYVFDFQASEEMIDAIRLIPLHDKKTIEHKGKSYIIDELLIEPNWQPHGDLANIIVTFRTNTIALVGGRGTNQVYEPEAGSCLVLAHNCIAFVLGDSSEYDMFQYLNSTGETVDLQDGDKIVKGLGNSLTVELYNNNSYTTLPVLAGETVYSSNNNQYYGSGGSNILFIPAIQFYDRDAGTFAATALQGATHLIFQVVGSQELLIGNYTYDDIVGDGTPITFFVDDEATDIRMQIGSASCGVFFTTDDYTLSNVGNNQGIGNDAIGVAKIGSN